MLSAIIYASKEALTPQHRIVQSTCKRGVGYYNAVNPEDGPHIFVRMEIVAADALHALDMAAPLAGETILNSMEL